MRYGLWVETCLWPSFPDQLVKDRLNNAQREKNALNLQDHIPCGRSGYIIALGCIAHARATSHGKEQASREWASKPNSLEWETQPRPPTLTAAPSLNETRRSCQSPSWESFPELSSEGQSKHLASSVMQTLHSTAFKVTHRVCCVFHFFPTAILALGRTRKAQHIRNLDAEETWSWQSGSEEPGFGNCVSRFATEYCVIRQAMQVCLLQSPKETSPTHHRSGAWL